jgi:phosphate starvation-inducible PhoH-like protein
MTTVEQPDPMDLNHQSSLGKPIKGNEIRERETRGIKGTKDKKAKKPRKQNEKEIMNEYLQQLQEHSNDFEKTNMFAPLNASSSFNTQKEPKFTKPKNKHQEDLVCELKDKNKKIIFITGPAGTGKTLFATEYGIHNFISGGCEKLIFTRPSVSVDEDLGFLPGTLEDKMAPWIRPIYDILYNFISVKEVQYLNEEKLIEIAPLGFMRGRTFKNTWIVADEMQNCTISQMKMLLTRLGDNSRLIITGDLEQYDRPNEINGLEDFLNKFKGKQSSSIVNFQFEKNDIQREEVVKEILDIYDWRN